MGKEKGGFLTPKAIANRIKSKGLQKLRWYCQMCQKQCRDENGFKCHCMSESHQRQLLLVAEKPGAFNDHFSNEFLKEFMELLKRRFNTRRVHNNVVYNEYIGFKEHIHMNSTKWVTLTEFTKWLGREGYCKVDQTEKGWFIQYIDRDPEVIRRQKELEKIKKKEKDDDERHARAIEDMVRRGKERDGDENELELPSTSNELQREDEDQKITFAMQTPSVSSKKASTAAKPRVDIAKSEKVFNSASGQYHKMNNKKRKKTALEEIMDEEEKKRKIVKKTDYWLTTDIIVKVITKRLGEKYHKKKGVVLDVTEKYTAIIKMIDTGAKIKVDQMHVETVLPALGKTVLILNGAYRGSTATLENVNVEQFNATVKISEGPLAGRKVDAIPYEDISKKHESLR
uniref:DNA/RNA-binding protein KIN17-like n=1 Tax=Styela clava TaxID=7725 RepID=UPI00193A5A60|nr:DNA/RNA-binding protein KIN17-like [Styela clava]